MKIALIINDDSYFWVLDESGRSWQIWQCWLENGDEPAIRMSTWDEWTLDAVYEHLTELIIEESNNTDPDLNK